MPDPPKIASTTKTTRNTSGSMSVYRPRPPATPATLRSVRLRRSGGRGEGNEGEGNEGGGPDRGDSDRGGSGAAGAPSAPAGPAYGVFSVMPSSSARRLTTPIRQRPGRHPEPTLSRWPGNRRMRWPRLACDDPAVTSTSAQGAPPRRLYRVSDGRVLAGVARGLAEHLGVDVLIVRLAFVVLAVAGGAGIVMYGAFWMFAALQPDQGPGERDTLRDLGPLIALASLVLGVLLLLSAFGVGLDAGLTVPLFVVGFGVVILWRQADDAQRERFRAATTAHPRSGLVRGAVGITLVLAGAGAILYGPADLG